MKYNESDDIAHFVKSTRNRLGLGRTEFASLLGMGASGERTVRGWELGEHIPSSAKLTLISGLEESLLAARAKAPFVNPIANSHFTFIDLFAGIGGIRLGFQMNGGKCVFSSEWDKFAQKTYLANFGEMPHGDITKISADKIPDHDVLLAGFPCQAFSQAGLKKGFNDTRGTMFFEIQRILAEKRPKAFLLENVKQLRGHDKGRTLETILKILRGENESTIPSSIALSKDAREALSEKLNYWVDFRVLRAGDFGIPQNRERIYIVGFDKNYFSEDAMDNFSWPAPENTATRVGSILEKINTKDDERYTISDRLWAGHQKRKMNHAIKGNGFGYSLVDTESTHTNTLSARYYKDGSEILVDQSKIGKNPRKLTPRECANLQGFPKEFIVDAVSMGQIYKQFGNSVCVTVVDKIAEKMSEFIKKQSKKKKVKVAA